MANTLLTPGLFSKLALQALNDSIQRCAEIAARRYAEAYDSFASMQAEAMALAPKMPWVGALPALTPAETEMVNLLLDARAELVARREVLAWN